MPPITDVAQPAKLEGLIVTEGDSGQAAAVADAKVEIPSPLTVVSVADAKPETPDPTPFKRVSVAEMPPVIGAGVKLARLVLCIAAGSIVLLLLYLVSMELVIGNDVHHAYEQVLNPSRIGSEFYTLGRLEKFSVDLNTARKDPALQLSADSAENAQGILNMLDMLPSVTSTQKAQVKDCVPLPQASASRNEKLDRCISILESVRQAALEAAAGTTNAQLAGESANRINEHRSSLHTFWIQAAQLILLNLLLPLLTALFGYVFGTQQGHQTKQQATNADV